MPEIRFQVSSELHALATGYAGHGGKTLERYTLDALLEILRSDSESNLVKELPEYHAKDN